MTRVWVVSASGGVVALVVLALAACAGPSATRTAASAEAGEEVLWRAGMEDGTLGEWARQGDGGEFDSGNADARVAAGRARSGRHSAELVWRGPEESGTRLFRWGESRRNRDLFYQAWFFFPERYALTGDARTGRYWDLFQFKSTTFDGSRNDPIWFIGVRSALKRIGARRGRSVRVLVPQLVWWPRGLEGPRRGERGSLGLVRNGVSLPVGRWFRIRARVRQSSGFDGVVQIWLGGRRIFDLRHVRTGYRNCRYNWWCVDQGWSVNLYSDGLSPAPARIYVDDARILAR